jgi:hypothetical protein
MFSDNAGTVAGTVITLDSRGEPAVIKMIWLDTTVVYKFILKDSSGTIIWTEDNVNSSQIFDGSITTAKLASPIAPTVSSVNSGQLAGFRNKLINPDFKIWQRANYATGFTVAAYGPDRWYIVATSSTINRSASPDNIFTIQPTAITNSASIRQVIPFTETQSLRGKYVTFSLKIKSLTQEISPKVTIQIHYNNTEATQTSGTWVSLGSVSFTTLSSYSTESITSTQVVPASARAIRVGIVVSDAVNGNDIAIKECQLEEGSIATPFEWRQNFIDYQMALGFYEKSYSTTTLIGASTSVGAISQVEAKSTSQLVYGAIRFAFPKISTPTVTLYSTTGASGNIRDITAAGNVTAVASDIGETGCRVESTGTTFVAGNMYAYHYVAEAEYT